MGLVWRSSVNRSVSIAIVYRVLADSSFQCGCAVFCVHLKLVLESKSLFFEIRFYAADGATFCGGNQVKYGFQ